jgi:hypothetical protein
LFQDYSFFQSLRIPEPAQPFLFFCRFPPPLPDDPSVNSVAAGVASCSHYVGASTLFYLAPSFFIWTKHPLPRANKNFNQHLAFPVFFSSVFFLVGAHLTSALERYITNPRAFSFLIEWSFLNASFYPVRRHLLRLASTSAD